MNWDSMTPIDVLYNLVFVIMLIVACVGNIGADWYYMGCSGLWLGVFGFWIIIGIVRWVKTGKNFMQ